MADGKEITTLHFDLSFLPKGDTPLWLHVGTERIALCRHTEKSRTRCSTDQSIIGRLPAERVTHYAEKVSTPSDGVQLLLLKTPSQLPDARLDTLLLSMIHLPRAARRKMVENHRAENHPDAAKAHPKLLQYGLEMNMLADASPIVDVHDYKTAFDVACSLVYHHQELVNTGATTGARVHSIIEYANGTSDLAMSIYKQALEHQKDPGQQNWTYETPYLDGNGRPTQRSYYDWSDGTKEWMKGPMLHSIRRAKNDTQLESTATNAGVYTVTEGTTNVNAPQPQSPVAQAEVLESGTYWTINNLTPKHGFSQTDPVRLENNQFSVSFKNDWLRWLSGYVEFLGADGSVVTPAGWESKLPGTLAGTYDTDTKKYVAMFSSVNTILAVPVGNSPTEIKFPWPSNAAAVRIRCGGIGRTGGIVGADGKYHGGWDAHVCSGGTVMTSIFNFGIPTVCLLAGASVSLSALNELAKTVITIALDIGSTLITGIASSSIQGGSTSTVMIAALDMIPRLLLDAPLIAVWFAEKVAEGAAKEASPILGWIALAVSVASDVALLLETSIEVASSPASFELIATRSVDATWTLLPDVNHQNTWPLEATHYEVTATFKDGTARKTTGKLTGSPQTGPITIHFNGTLANRLPAGGEVSFAARFYSDTGWLAGAATSDFMSADAGGNLLTVPQQHIKENLIPLTATTSYQFDKKLTLDAASGKRVWSANGGAPTTTGKALSSNPVGNNLAVLTGITLRQETSELGYGWQASGQGIPMAGSGPAAYSGQQFTFQGIDDRATPSDGLRFVPYGFTDKPLLVYELMGKAAAGSGCTAGWVDPRQGYYHLRPVTSGSGAVPFDLQPGTSWGRFNEQMDALLLHPSGCAVGINTTTAKIEILRFAAGGPVADADAPLANIYGGYGSRPGLLHQPVGIAALPDSGVVVLEGLDTALKWGEARLQAFDLFGNPAPIFAGNSPVAALQTETAPVTVLDVAVESKGFIYVLKFLNDGHQASDYRLDLYRPDGSWLSQTPGVSAARITVDLWRTMYTLNFEQMVKPAGGRTEPSVSIWLPSTPGNG